MYKRILLAYDGSVEGRAALSEGAQLARRCGAEVFLLSIVNLTPGLRVAEGAYGGAVAGLLEGQKEDFDAGMARLRELGLEPRGKVVAGEPSQEVSACARQMAADLVVVGHRRQLLVHRWWAGLSGAYLADQISCSLLICRGAAAAPG